MEILGILNVGVSAEVTIPLSTISNLLYNYKAGNKMSVRQVTIAVI